MFKQLRLNGANNLLKEQSSVFGQIQNKPFLSIILPSLNEEQSIQKVIEEIKTINLPKNEIIVVDGCSTDATIKIVKKLNIKIIIEPKRGYGIAINRGVNAAKGEIIVILDSDYTYPASYIPQLIVPLVKNEADLVLGNRLTNKCFALMKKSHLFGNIILTLWFNVIFLSRFKDTQTGFRAFRKNDFERLGIRSNGIFFPSEFLFKALKKRFRIVEIPIKYRLRIGKSKLSPLRDGILILLKMLINGIF